MPFAENGIRVHFPDNNSFRLSDCQAYITISGKGVKEMDIGWFDLNTNTLWLVELKAFNDPNNIRYTPKDLSNQDIVEDVIRELLGKSIHTICQISTNRAGTQSCMSVPISLDTTINLVYLIRTMPGQDVYLNHMQDKLRTDLKPFIAIFNIAAIAVISYDYAVANRLLNWIV